MLIGYTRMSMVSRVLVREPIYKSAKAIVIYQWEVLLEVSAAGRSFSPEAAYACSDLRPPTSTVRFIIKLDHYHVLRCQIVQVLL